MAAFARLAFLPLVLAYPVPPEQTEDQIQIFKHAQAAAQIASAAATPAVLEFFDSTSFRDMLQDCCPQVATWSSQDLLQRYRAEAAVAELAHALPKDDQQRTPSVDVTISELGKMAFFPNEFQVAMMNNESLEHSEISDDAMKDIFGCKAFAGSQPTWSEASSRLIYVAHNLRRLDTGSEPHFGDFTVIFNSSRLAKAVIIAPYDTGMYTMKCLHPDLHPDSQPGPGPRGMPDLNCSAWSKDRKVTVPAGTLDYLDHLILPNLWSPINTSITKETVLDAARVLFSRSAISGIDYEDVTGIQQNERNDYLESNILANPSLPESVKFGIANFASLFGTSKGEELQQISLRFQWPLVWAYGEGQQTGPQPPQGAQLQKLNRRIADPQNFLQLTNASMNSTAAQQFQSVWKQALEIRAQREISDDDLLSWWTSLDQQLKVAPVSAYSCADPHQNIGVDLMKSCIGKKPKVEIFTV